MSPANAVGREALIKAACDLLEQMPPAKVTRAEVARHAGVDPALIRYYFRDRASLLKAVVEQIVSTIGPPLSAEEASPEERLRAGIRSFFRFMVEHPYFHRLVIEELAGADSDEAREIFRAINAGSVARFADILKDGAAAGTLKPVNPVLLHIAQIGLCEFFVAARPIIESSLGRDVDINPLADEYADMIADMLLGGLKPAG